MKASFLRIEDKAEGMGLKLNAAKTKYMLTSSDSGRTQNVGPNITIGAHNFEAVNEFVYLRSSVNSSNLH